MARKGYVGFGINILNGKLLVLSVEGVGILEEHEESKVLDILFEDADEEDKYLDYKFNRSFYELEGVNN